MKKSVTRRKTVVRRRSMVYVPPSHERTEARGIYRSTVTGQLYDVHGKRTLPLDVVLCSLSHQLVDVRLTCPECGVCHATAFDHLYCVGFHHVECPLLIFSQEEWEAL